jgi:hypothetical protein
MHFSRYGDTNRRLDWSNRCAKRFIALICLWLAGSVWASAAMADDDTPTFDRPGYGFAPVVVGAGDVAFEQGLPDWSRDRSGGMSVSLYQADSLLRVGVGDSLELQLGSSPWNYLSQTGDGPASSEHGRGDTSVGAKLTLPSSNPNFTWGLLSSVEFTDGDPQLRSAHPQYLLGLQLNLQATERNQLGAYLEDVHSGGRDSTTVALSDNYNLSKTLVAYVELAQMHTPDDGSGTVVGGGMAWLVSPRVQIDMGFDRRVAGNTFQWQANFGIAIYFGR